MPKNSPRRSAGEDALPPKNHRPVGTGTAALESRNDGGQPEWVWRLAYSALNLTRLVSDAPCSALFARAGGELQLLASRDVEQPHFDALREAWACADSGLTQGRAYAHPVPPFVALPCVDGTTIVGVVLLAWTSEHVHAGSGAALVPLGRVLGAVLRRLAAAAGATRSGATCVPPAEPAASDPPALALHVLLDQHEWNVARVARALGVTRMTVYNRMRAAGIARVHVPKSRRSPSKRPVLPDPRPNSHGVDDSFAEAPSGRA